MEAIGIDLFMSDLLSLYLLLRCPTPLFYMLMEVGSYMPGAAGCSILNESPQITRSMCVFVCLSLSLSIYIYISIYQYMYISHIPN